jgi:predicted RNase H-like HicB family nuclease
VSTLTAFIEWDPATSLYVGSVPGLPGVHTQAATLDELRANLQEVIELCREENPELFESLPQFIGLQQIQVAS